MSNIQETPDTPITPEEVVQQLRVLREHIPDFVILQRADATSLIRAANLDPVFVQSAINAVGASPTLSGAVGRTAEELRQDTELVARWSAVVEEIDALRAGAVQAARVRNHRIGLTALQTYKVSVQLVRKKEHAHLLPHVDAMKRRTKFKRRGAPPEVKPQPEPVAVSK